MTSFQWMIRRYTTADVHLSEDDLKQLEQRCDEIVVAQRIRFWSMVALTSITSGLAAAICGKTLGPVVASMSGWPEPLCRAGCALLAAAMALGIWLLVYTRMYVRPLRRALTELGYAVCERCGYWLHGLPPASAHCPECGTARKPLQCESS